MTANSPMASLRAYLDRAFPGSSFDEGYSFVFFKAPWFRRVAAADIQPVVEQLCVGETWLVAVNVDWKIVGSVKEDESQPVLYTPDWNVEEPYEEHVAVVDAPIPAEALLHSIRTPGALALVNPQLDLMLDIKLGRIYGRTKEAVDAFCDRLPGAFYPRDPAYGE